MLYSNLKGSLLKKTLKRLAHVVVALLATGSMTHAQTTNAITKVFDFNAVVGVSSGYANPVGHVVPVGTNFYFIDTVGATFAAGGITSYSYDTNSSNSSVSIVASFDNNSGKTPLGSLLVVSNRGWFTTQTGGTGNKGTLSYLDLTANTITAAYSFPTNPINGFTPHGDIIQISNELWFTTSSGGIAVIAGATNNTKGAVVKYNLQTGVLTPVFYLDGTNNGSMPFGGITQAGNNYYFTTFTGGTNAGSGFPNGGGTLERISFSSNGTPALTKLIDLPTNSAAFPIASPTLVNSNSLWFCTIGNAANPGGLIRYDLNTGIYTNVFSFSADTNFPYGKQPYGAITEWNQELYLSTFSGGAFAKGTILKYSITNSTMTKLADLDGTTNLALGASPQYNSSAIIMDPVTSRYVINFLMPKGGTLNYGTMLNVSLPAPALRVGISPVTNGNITLSWTGGYGPFAVQASSDLSIPNNWTSIATNLSTNSLIVPTGGGNQYFRVLGNP